MQVSERMTKNVRTCRVDDSLEHAARLLWDHDCGCLPVVSEHGHLHGMITDRDICMAAYTSGERLADLQVREAMAIDVASVSPGHSLRDAEMLMRDHSVRRLPVIDEEGRVIGLLSCNDLTRWVDDAGTIGRSQHDAVHLVRTLAIVGRPRGRGVADAFGTPVFLPAEPRPVLTPTLASSRPAACVAVASRHP